MVSLPIESCAEFSTTVGGIVRDEKISEELKWSKVGDGRYRRAARRIVSQVVKWCVESRLRIDVLAWDTHDNRHDVKGRDDRQNLGRMYYHLLQHVLRNRWVAGSTWTLLPDKQDLIQWDNLDFFLSNANLIKQDRNSPLLPLDAGRPGFRTHFSIVEIEECCSHDEPLIQTADLFTGMAVWSRHNYPKYQAAAATASNQTTLSFPSLDANNKVRLSSDDTSRADIITHLLSECKSLQFGVGITTCKCLKTYNPASPINIWWYEPQHDNDRAPTRLFS